MKWKQQLFTYSTLFCTFLCCRCTTTTWKCLISRFMEDVNDRRWNFCSLSELGNCSQEGSRAFHEGRVSYNNRKEDWKSATFSLPSLSFHVKVPNITNKTAVHSISFPQCKIFASFFFPRLQKKFGSARKRLSLHGREIFYHTRRNWRRKWPENTKRNLFIFT